ncbi:MAG TPA: thioesterase family protein [Sphingobium sp.]|uniref:thioesterase family protein n=1 Tax=Sphingobium sp. TaxID=1912891 RepID=UPI002ED1F1F6
MSVTRFSQILASLTQDAGSYGVVVPDDWLQGRTTYGGLSAALCVAAAEEAIGGEMPLRSAQFCFIGPTVGAVHVHPTILRCGKTTTIVAVDLHANGALAVRGMLVFGASRPSAFEYASLSPPSALTLALEAPIETCEPFFGGPGTPAFARHFEARQAGRAALVSGAVSADFLVWVRHADHDGGSSFAALIALGDALPPPATALFSEPAPISTITWSVDFPVQPILPHTTGWLLMESRAETIAAGYSTQAMTLWSPAGEAVMISRQNVAIFA